MSGNFGMQVDKRYQVSWGRKKNNCAIEIKRKINIVCSKMKGDFFPQFWESWTSRNKEDNEDGISSELPEENLSRFPGS